MAPICQLCGSGGGGFRKGQWPLPAFLSGRKLSPNSLSMPDTSVPLHLPWCLSTFYPSAGAYREWVWVSSCVGSSSRTAWNSRSYFHWLNPYWFLQPEAVGTYLPGTGTLGWRPGAGLVLLTPKISLLNFYLPHVGVGPVHSVSPPLSPMWMDVVSLIP